MCKYDTKLKKKSCEGLEISRDKHVYQLGRANWSTWDLSVIQTIYMTNSGPLINWAKDASWLSRVDMYALKYM